MGRNSAARPAPDLQQPGVEIWILLQDKEVEENSLLISRRAERNQNVPALHYTYCHLFSRRFEDQIKA